MQFAQTLFRITTLQSALLLFSILFTLNNATAQEESVFKEHLDSNAVLVKSGYNYTVEKYNKHKYVRKTYFRETRQITHLITYNSKLLNVKEGLYREWYDDGTVYIIGDYINGKEEGEWTIGIERGIFKNGKRQGVWVRYNDEKRITGTTSYLDGKFHGTSVSYDSLGIPKYESVYNHGELVSTTMEKDTTKEERMPMFPGCQNQGLSKKEEMSCAQKKMLQYIYKNIHYPDADRENNIGGQAIVSFTIEKDGSVVEVKVLRGLSKTIKAECLRIVQNMPDWTIALQQGKPVRVQFNLPIRFKLK